ncbi:hypothetical protein [Mycolicibacterium sp. HK-90]|uniref:DUF7373 family lipoprotein n=1 Tax=Mycolicibacterium sp. HK-90 TaxID=3056937 RepID=UPI00265A9DB8|nr:hypothetical protein [Mycolicibacterium sp. HK-90]WKG03613.1 hypothetical protein QU592_00205 [Mycolicibacterium sp. HK-90]
MRLLGVVGGLTLAVGLTGCSTVIEGAAVKDPAVAADAVNTALLRPGNYDTAPYPAPKPDAQTAKQVDAQRLADHVVGPWQVDPALTLPLVATIGPALSDRGVDHVIGAPVGQIAVDHRFINGFVTSRANTLKAEEPRTSLVNMVLRFPTAEDAAAVAAAAHEQMPAGGTAPEPASIAGHPAALATRRPIDGGAQVISFTAHGPYVLYQSAKTPEGRAPEELVAKALDLQIPAVDAFKPTDPAQFPTMELDPTHLIARTLRIKKPTTMQGVYGRHGVLHYDHPDLAGPMEAAGVDAVSIGQTQMYVYQTRDPAAAKELAAKIAESLGKEAKPSETVPGMPTAKCFDAAGASLLMLRAGCVVAADRWVLRSASQQPRDAAQQLAAQYLMLVGK